MKFNSGLMTFVRVESASCLSVLVRGPLRNKLHKTELRGPDKTALSPFPFQDASPELFAASRRPERRLEPPAARIRTTTTTTTRFSSTGTQLPSPWGGVYGNPLQALLKALYSEVTPSRRHHGLVLRSRPQRIRKIPR